MDHEFLLFNVNKQLNGQPNMSGFPKIILVYTLVDWDLFMRRKAIYALAEAAREYGSTVVAVNRPLCPTTTAFRKPNRFAELFGRARLRQLDENLYLYSPRYFVHDSISQKVGALESLNLTALRLSYNSLCGRIGIHEDDPIVWFYHPVQGYVTRLFPGSFNIMEIKDNITDVHGNESVRDKRTIDALKNNVDVLLTASSKLHEKYSQGFRFAWRSFNGIDRQTYKRLIRGDETINPAIANIPGPRIGYTGLISQRLDWTLITEIARLKPEWNFVFVGRMYDKALPEEIRSIKNLHFTGGFEHSEMPSILSGFDVGFMPYLDNEFFRYSNPLKIYEYAAAGLPTVSSDMEELRGYPEEIVRVVPNRAEDWIAAIQSHLDADSDSATSIGAEFASRFVWEDLATDLLDRIYRKFFSW